MELIVRAAAPIERLAKMGLARAREQGVQLGRQRIDDAEPRKAAAIRRARSKGAGIRRIPGDGSRSRYGAETDRRDLKARMAAASGVERKMVETRRVETGRMQFGKDWPGVFIRGDDALSFANSLQTILDEVEPRAMELSEAELRVWSRAKELVDLLKSCRTSR